MKASQLDKLLDCNCDTCDFKHYRNTEDCDIHRKRAILLALKAMVLQELNKYEPINPLHTIEDAKLYHKRILESVAKLFEDSK